MSFKPLSQVKNPINIIQPMLADKKIFLSASIGWIIFIGFLTWLNGVNDIALIKQFKWDEWFWFGIVPAIAPYIFSFIWKKKDIDKDQQPN